MRTDAEKMAFAKECLKIEKQGGNVQEYIAQNWPSYTPRATWYNLQKQYLCRNVNQLTEGKPKTERKEVKNMTKRRDRNVVFDEIVKIIEAHGDPVAWFEENDYSFPITGWQDLKKWARVHRPDEVHKLPENLRRYYAANGIERVYKTRDEKKSGENPTEEVKAPETVVMNGKEYEKMDGTIKAGGLALPPFDTSSYENEMIAPAYLRNPVKPSGVTVPDELPVCAVKSGCRKDAKYELCGVRDVNEGFMAFIWRDLINHSEQELAMSASQWRKFMDEIPKALTQLGL